MKIFLIILFLIFITKTFSLSFSEKKVELIKILQGDVGHHSHSHYHHHHRRLGHSHSSSSSSSSSSSESRERRKDRRRKYTLMSQRYPRPIPYFP